MCFFLAITAAAEVLAHLSSSIQNFRSINHHRIITTTFLAGTITSYNLIVTSMAMRTKKCGRVSTRATKNEMVENVSWIGHIEPMMRQKFGSFEECCSVRLLLNFKRIQSHSRHVLPRLQMSQDIYVGQEVVLRFADDEKKILIQFLENPRLILSTSVNELRTALRVVMEIKLTVIPSYLAALYSLKTSPNYVSIIIQRIVYQKFAQYVLANNLFVAIGGIHTSFSAKSLTKYPRELPNGLGDGQLISIRKLSYGLNEGEGDDTWDLKQVKSLMAIEKPDFVRIPRLVDGNYVVDDECIVETTPNTVGQLYACILAALASLSKSGKISFDNEKEQIDAYLPNDNRLFPITSFALAEMAINVIASNDTSAANVSDGLSPFSSDRNSNLDSFFLLSEIYHRRRITLQYNQFGALKGFSYTGAKIKDEELESYDMISNPSLEMIPKNTEAFQAANKFAQTWEQLMECLHYAVAFGPSCFIDFLRRLHECRETSRETMTIEMPNSGGKVVGCTFEKPDNLGDC